MVSHESLTSKKVVLQDRFLISWGYIFMPHAIAAKNIPGTFEGNFEYALDDR